MRCAQGINSVFAGTDVRLGSTGKYSKGEFDVRVLGTGKCKEGGFSVRITIITLYAQCSRGSWVDYQISIFGLLFFLRNNKLQPRAQAVMGKLQEFARSLGVRDELDAFR